MENQGRYDCAVFGESLAGMVTALLLTRQGERVILIPEPKARVRDSRLQFGLEEQGILYRLLLRWGLTESQLESIGTEDARVEIVSDSMAVSLRDDLKLQGLGSPRYEIGDATAGALWDALHEIEKDGSWRKHFQDEFLKGLMREKEGWRRYAFVPRSAARVWSRSLRKALSQKLKSSKISQLSQVNDPGQSARRNELFSGAAFLMGPGRFRISSGRFPLLQTLLEIYALRRTPFAFKNGEPLREKLRQVLKSQGVRFIQDGENVHFKRDSSGEWEGFFGNPKDGAIVHFRFNHFMFAHSLNARSLALFEDDARKKLERELRDDPCVYMRWRAHADSRALPFPAGTELVGIFDRDAPIRVSIYGKEDGTDLKTGESLIEVTAWLPIHSGRGKDEIAALRAKLQPRIEREIFRVFPGLTADCLSKIEFECERLRDFSPGSGVRSRDRTIWHVNHTSFPSLGEFGPVVAGIELARQFARRDRRELKL